MLSKTKEKIRFIFGANTHKIQTNINAMLLNKIYIKLLLNKTSF